MPFFNKRGRGSGGKNFNNRKPNKFFRGNRNRPGAIRKNVQEFANNSGLRQTNGPRRNRRGGRRNDGNNNRRMPKNNGKFASADNLDKDLDSYWGKDHKETRERILNDDLESYWDKKPSKQDKPEDELNQVHPSEQKTNEVKETMAVHPSKKKNVVDNVDL